jgi:adenylate cyclase
VAHSARRLGALDRRHLPAELARGGQWTELLRSEPHVAGAFKRNPEFGRKVRQALETTLEKDTALATGRASTLLKAWIRLYEGPDSFYLNFYGPAGTIPTIPYYAIVSHDSSGVFEHAFDLTDKAVFVGFSELTEPTKPDRIETVFSRSTV